MMHKGLLIVCLWAGLVGCSRQGVTEDQLGGRAGENITADRTSIAEIPSRVVYKEAIATVNTKATEKILAAFSTNHTDADGIALLQDRVLICGPYLWEALRDSPELTNLICTVTAIHVPQYRDGEVASVDTLEAQAFQTTGEVARFWQAFERHYDFSSTQTIRRLNALELDVYWSMIPYDIEEPIFVVESPQSRIMLDFVEPETRVIWIDDYQEIAVLLSNTTLKAASDAPPQ